MLLLAFVKFMFLLCYGYLCYGMDIYYVMDTASYSLEDSLNHSGNANIYSKRNKRNKMPTLGTITYKTSLSSLRFTRAYVLPDGT